MKKLGITYQHARAYVHSPDSLYEEKLAHIQHVISLYKQGEIEVLFADQFTYYNHAEVNRGYAAKYNQPKAQRAIGGARQRRIAACMNCFTGQVTYIQRQKTTIPALVKLYKDVVEVYKQAQTIYIILDNWPVHYHPDIMEAFIPQTNPFDYKLPKSWEKLKPKGKYKKLNLPIQLVSLPTYASWLNPIEKLWKWLKKELIHQHNFAHHFKELFNKVELVLDDFDKPSSKMLSFAGLLKQDGIFADSIALAKPHFFNFGG